MDNHDQSNIKEISENCPYLGIRGEPGSFFGYASSSNACFRVKKPGYIKLSHQERFCLNPTYSDCEVFNTANLDTLPESIKRETKERTTWFGIPWIRFGIYTIIAITITAVFLFLIFKRPLYGNANQETEGNQISTEGNRTENFTPSPTSTPDIETEDFVLGILKEGTATPEQTPTKTPIPSLTPTITPSFTPEFTPGPGFETPFGPNEGYLIHVVAEGENYFKIAENYDTSAEVLRETNLLPEGMGLRAGLIIVILPGIKDPAGLPQFVAVLIDRPMVAQEIAQVYQSEANLILEYNQIDANKPVPVGRWLIIPYP
jgi:hypothetical protein